MFMKKIRLLALSLLVVFGLFATLGRTAAAQTITDNGIDLSGQGVFVPGGFTAENYTITLVPANTTMNNPVKFVVTENIARTGNQGVYIPAGLNLESMAVHILEPSAAPLASFLINRPVIHLAWMGEDMQQIPVQGEEANQTSTTTTSPPSHPVTLMYVFYNLDPASKLAWDEGSLNIYYYDVENNTWTACPSFFVAGNSNSGRVACIAPQFTYYALGITEKIRVA